MGKKKELACGENAVDCTAISNLAEGDDAVACVEGNCKVNRCEAGYYISGNSCRLCPGTYDAQKTAQVVTSDGIKCQYKCFYSSRIKDCTPDGVDGAVYDRPEDLVCLFKGNGWKSADYDSEIIPDWSEYNCRSCRCRQTGRPVDWDRANMRCVCLK